MAFGETIGAKTFDLAKTGFGKFALIAACRHAIDHFGVERANRADLFESGHGAAQFVGLRRSKASRDNGDFHRLFLKQRHAERLAQNLFQLF